MANKPPEHPVFNTAVGHIAGDTPSKPFFMSAENVMSSPLETADWEQLSKKTADNISWEEGQLKTKPALIAEEKNMVIVVMVLPVAF